MNFFSSFVEMLRQKVVVSLNMKKRCQCDLSIAFYKSFYLGKVGGGLSPSAEQVRRNNVFHWAKVEITVNIRVAQSIFSALVFNISVLWFRGLASAHSAAIQS